MSCDSWLNSDVGIVTPHPIRQNIARNRRTPTVIFTEPPHPHGLKVINGRLLKELDFETELVSYSVFTGLPYRNTQWAEKWQSVPHFKWL